jgi:hypothetical protein
MLNAALTSACVTNPQCGHSNRFRVLRPNPPHRLHRFEVNAGLTYITGIPRPRARFSTSRCSEKNDPFSNENSNDADAGSRCE